MNSNKILEIFKKQIKFINANYKDIVESSEVLYFPSGLADKLRIYFFDESFADIRYSVSNKYSYHWELRHIKDKIYRYDNAPHKIWKKVQTYPKHFHKENE